MSFNYSSTPYSADEFGRAFTLRPGVRQWFVYLIVAVCLTLMSSIALAEKINLNSANSEALQYIPGIGPGKATKIIETRTALGKFQSIEELDQVPGIGPKLLEAIRQFGVVEGGVSELTEAMKANPPSGG